MLEFSLMAQIDQKRGSEGIQIGYPIEHSLLEKKHEKIGIILPGQDVRSIGMFDKWMEHPAGREVIERGNAILKDEYGIDLIDLAKSVEEEDVTDTQRRADILKRTEFTQPAVYLLSMAIHNVNKHAGRKDGYRTIPGYLTGISMGMGTAAALAGYMDFETGLRFHAERGKIMQEKSDPTPTSMVTLIGDEDKVQDYLRREENSMLDLCIINSDSLWVVGGPDNPNDPESPMQRVRHEAKGAGFKRVLEVNTDRAMHGRYVRPAREAFDKLVDETQFNNPHSFVLSSITGLPITTAEEMKAELKAGFDGTIDNRKPVEYMKEHGIHIVHEIGNEKGFFARLVGNHVVQAAAVGVVGAIAVGAAEVWTLHHPDHPENGKK